MVHDLDAAPRGDALRFIALVTRTPAVDLSIRAHEAIIDGRDVLFAAPASRLALYVDAFNRADRGQSAIQQ
jgi:hypothetical protein